MDFPDSINPAETLELLLAASHSCWAVSPAEFLEIWDETFGGKHGKDTQPLDLVGGGYLPLWKIMEWKSVGMIFPLPTEWKVIIHSMVPVTTNQWWSWWLILIFPWKKWVMNWGIPSYPHRENMKFCPFFLGLCRGPSFFLSKWYSVHRSPHTLGRVESPGALRKNYW